MNRARGYIKLLGIIPLLWGGPGRVWAQNPLTVDGSFQQQRLEVIFDSLSQSYGLSFSYDESLIKDKSASIKWDNALLQEALEKLLKPHGLDFEVLRQKFVLIKIDTSSHNKASVRELCGTVLDKIHSTPLAYASVFLKRTREGRVTGLGGEFDFAVRAASVDTLVIQYMGYQIREIPLRDMEGCKPILLSPKDFHIEDVIISEYLTEGIEQNALSQALRFIPDQMRTLPGLVEPDIMLGIQLLPGVTSPEETASEVFIRGGTPDQNLVLWDKIPMYQTGHFFGMLSAFNPYIVDQVEVFRGGFPADYGNRISGVIDIRTHEQVPDAFQGGAGVSMTHGHVFMKFPLVKKKLGMYFSFRRSFTDFLPTPTFQQYQRRVFQGTRINDFEEISEEFDEVTPVQEFFFDDFNLSLHYQPSPRDHIRATFLTSNNLLDYQVQQTEEEIGLTDFLQQENGGLGLSWTHEAQKGHKTEVNLYSTAFSNTYEVSYSTLNPDRVLNAGRQVNRITDVGVEIRQQWKLSPNHALRVGYLFNGLDLYYEFGEEEFGEEPLSESENPKLVTHSLFGGYRFEKAGLGWLDASIRYLEYPLAEKKRIEPRLGLGFSLSKHLQVKAHAGRYQQFLSKLIFETNEIGVGNRLWVLSDGADIPMIRSTQFSLGLSYKNKGWQIDAEAYRKRLQGISTLSATFGNLPELGFNPGTANIQGIDFLVKKRWANYRSWISYSLSKVRYSFPTLFDYRFPASHDQRHVFSWSHVFSHGPWRLGLSWNYASGRPFTPLGGTEVETVREEESQETVQLLQPVLGPQNSQRLPDYHRMDFSAMYSFPQHPQAGWEMTLGVSIFNLYNRSNILSRQYFEDDIDDDEPESVEVFTLEKVLLKRTPNIVVRITW